MPRRVQLNFMRHNVTKFLVVNIIKRPMMLPYVQVWDCFDERDQADMYRKLMIKENTHRIEYPNFQVLSFEG